MILAILFVYATYYKVFLTNEIIKNPLFIVVISRFSKTDCIRTLPIDNGPVRYRYILANSYAIINLIINLI